MAKFKPKPTKELLDASTIVDAVQLTECVKFTCSKTGETNVARPGDWLITDANGVQFPCAGEKFERTFEPLNSEPAPSASPTWSTSALPDIIASMPANVREIVEKIAKPLTTTDVADIEHAADAGNTSSAACSICNRGTGGLWFEYRTTPGGITVPHMCTNCHDFLFPPVDIQEPISPISPPRPPVAKCPNDCRRFATTSEQWIRRYGPTVGGVLFNAWLALKDDRLGDLHHPTCHVLLTPVDKFRIRFNLANQ